jgi:carbonic anhydrase
MRHNDSKLTSIDCGVTHFHDDDVKKALLEVTPEAEELINASKFGEIKTS